MASTVWNAWMLFRDIPFSFRKVNWKKHLRHVWVTYLISLFYSVPLLLDSVLLRLVSTVSAVGMYVFSAKIVRTGVTLLTDSFLVFFPRIVSLGSKSDNSQLRDKLLLNIQFVILVSLPMGMGLYLLADELTIVFLGNQFMPVADNIRLLSVFPFLKGVSLFLSNPVLIAHDKEKSFLRNLVFSTALFVFAALLLGYYYNDFGVCIALVAVELFLLLANYISVKRSFPGLPVFDFVTLGHSVAGSLLLIPVVYLVKWIVPSNWQQLAACIPACILVYGLFLFLVRNTFMMQIRGIAGRFVSRNF
jgi:O-antigen/teichoic acid export membrane protein